MTERCGFDWPGETKSGRYALTHTCRLDEDHPTAHLCECGAEHDPIIEGDDA